MHWFGAECVKNISFGTKMVRRSELGIGEWAGFPKARDNPKLARGLLG